jgi:hypothetical protein
MERQPCEAMTARLRSRGSDSLDFVQFRAYTEANVLEETVVARRKRFRANITSSLEILWLPARAEGRRAASDLS